MPISEQQKTNARKFHLFLANLVQRLIAAPVAVTYNDNGGREKRESSGRYQMKTILIINI
jgi:hypothetical protein